MTRLDQLRNELARAEANYEEVTAGRRGPRATVAAFHALTQAQANLMEAEYVTLRIAELRLAREPEP